MIHPRSDYDRIQDPENKIGEDEPVFLLRAKDQLAPLTVMFWACLVEQEGADEYMVNKIKDWAVKMEDWGKENGNKLPDTPKELLK